MGLSGISIWQLLIVLVIVVVLFGTSKLRNIGSDLGGAIKSFKKSMAEDDEADEHQQGAGDNGTAEAKIEQKTEAHKEQESAAGSGNGAAKQKQSS